MRRKVEVTAIQKKESLSDNREFVSFIHTGIEIYKGINRNRGSRNGHRYEQGELSHT